MLCLSTVYSADCFYLRAGITWLPLLVDREESSCWLSLNTSTSLMLELVRAVPALQTLNRPWQRTTAPRLGTVVPSGKV